IQLMSLGEQRVDASLDDAAPLARCEQRAPLRNETAGAAPLVNDAARFEIVVGLDDGVRRDFELQRERPDRRQLLAGLQQSGRDQVLHLIHDLAIDRDAVAQVDLDVHSHAGETGRGKVYRYSDTICGARSSDYYA